MVVRIAPRPVARLRAIGEGGVLGVEKDEFVLVPGRQCREHGKPGGKAGGARLELDETLVVNVQGDEPFLPAALIEQAADLLTRDPAAGIATLAAPLGSLEEFLDPNVVKVVTALDGAAALLQPGADPLVA